MYEVFVESIVVSPSCYAHRIEYVEPLLLIKVLDSLSFKIRVQTH